MPVTPVAVPPSSLILPGACVLLPVQPVRRRIALHRSSGAARKPRAHSAHWKTRVRGSMPRRLWTLCRPQARPASVQAVGRRCGRADESKLEDRTTATMSCPTSRSADCAAGARPFQVRPSIGRNRLVNSIYWLRVLLIASSIRQKPDEFFAVHHINSVLQHTHPNPARCCK
jgi:hypothetical protein